MNGGASYIGDYYIIIDENKKKRVFSINPYTYNHPRDTLTESKLGKVVNVQLLRSSLKNRHQIYQRNGTVDKTCVHL